MSAALSLLLEPFALRGLELRNRVVFLPHVTFYAEGQRPSARHRDYHEERARGGVGLIVTESQVVHPTGGHGKCVDAGDREAMLAWGETIDAVHTHGTRIVAQLTHHGVEAFTADTMRPLWAPSAVPSPVLREIPKPMTVVEIQAAQEAFRQAAKHAVEAGFDGVELKVGHDGLLRAFLSPYYNRRDDDYGGAPERRARFVLETLAAVRDVVPDLPLGIRFCLDEGFPGGYDADQGLELAQVLAGSGLLDYVSADEGTWTSLEHQVPPMTVPQGFADASTAALRSATGLPVIAFGRIKDPHHAARLLSSGAADLIGMARQLITDPEWVIKVSEGRLDEIRPCVACNQECVGRLVRELPISCVHNPAAGREGTLGVRTLKRARPSRRVVVAGGGPAGLKAAEVAALRGHDVTLLERGGTLGGQVALAATAPHHAEWGEIVTHLTARVHALGVDVRPGAEATRETVLAGEPDAVIAATGARPGPPPFPTDGSVAVLDEWQALAQVEPREARVLLLDHGVRFEGAALVESLLDRGNDVRWVAPTPTVGFEIDPPTLTSILPRLAAAGVERLPERTVVDATGGGVVLLNVLTNETERLDDVDAIVIAGNKLADGNLASELEGHVPTVVSIGDCVAPRHVAIAIYEGELAGRAV